MASQNEMPPEIGPLELKALRGGEEPYALLDVREEWELAIAGWPEALHLPLGELEARKDELPRDRPLVVVCRTGRRSRRATEFLRRQGFLNASNLRNGVHGWSAEVDPAMERY